MSSWQSMQLRLNPSISVWASSPIAVKRGLIEMSSADTSAGSGMGMPEPWGINAKMIAKITNAIASELKTLLLRGVSSVLDEFMELKIEALTGTNACIITEFFFLNTCILSDAVHILLYQVRLKEMKVKEKSSPS